MSKFIIKKRGGGKTTDLIKISAETGETIICKNYRRCLLVSRMAKTLGYKIPNPLSIGIILKGGRTRAELYENCRKSTGKVLIDDVDDVLEGLLGFPCAAITGSPDEEEQ